MNSKDLKRAGSLCVSVTAALPSVASAQSYMDRFQGSEPAYEAAVLEEEELLEEEVTVASLETAAPVTPASDPLLEELRSLRAELEQVAALSVAASEASLAAEAQSLQLEETSPASLSAGIGVNSHYAWRGLNYLQATSQKDQHAYVSPWLSAAIGDSGWSVGYWGAYQATGDNIASTTAGASSHENDLWVDWSTDVAGGAVSANVYGLAYLYPFADADVAGADVPTWVEPGAGLTWNGPVSIGASAAWYQAVQEPLRGGEYLYLNTSISGEQAVHDAIAVGLGASAGYKAGQGYIDNTLDLQLDWTLSIALDQLTLSPGTHVTWTNFEDAAPGEAYFVWWGAETEFAL